MNDIKQIAARDISVFLAENQNAILLDVRTAEEWQKVGKPDGEKLGMKTYFLSIMEGAERIFNENFVKDFQAQAIAQDQHIFIICRSGARSNVAAQLLKEAGFKNCINVADGFEGNEEVSVGWKQSQLPCK